MKTINVEGLPEPLANALEAVVQAIREQVRPQGRAEPRPKVKLLTKPGKVIGSLTRREIYEDVG
jgi:hypothetical protein